jgi:hypothetical protein
MNMLKPRAKHFLTDSGLHDAMRQWAASNRKADLLVEVVFSDGSVYNDVILRETVPCTYKALDMEVYTQDVTTAKYIWLGEVFTLPELKRTFKNWISGGLSNNCTVLSITYTKEQK